MNGLSFIVSDQTSPYLNVAVENYLVSLPDEGVVTLYLWKNRRTVVVGRNQNPFAECNVDALLADGGYVMRRTTGGGAVYHDDGNINFSFIAPYGLYDQTLHFEVIRQALNAFGLDAEVSGRNDLLCQGRKFSGNAFSKGRTQCLHHGTILINGNMDDLQRYLKVNPSKLHKHGVQSVQSRVVNLAELNPAITSDSIVPRLKEAFLNVYGNSGVASASDISNVQIVDFASVAALPQVQSLFRKFSGDEWIFAPWRNFTAQRSAQFEWGRVELSISIDENANTITDCQLATDALDVDLAQTVGTLLAGASSLVAPSIDAQPEALQPLLRDILSLVY